MQKNYNPRVVLAAGRGKNGLVKKLLTEKGHMIDLLRFEEAIKEREAAAPTGGKIIFYGSSTFTRWREDDIRRLLQRENILNLAFGGSTAMEAFHFAERVLFRHNPSALCYYEGDNDAAARCMSPHDAFRYTKLVLDHYTVPVFVVGVKYSPSRAHLTDFFDGYNALCLEYCKKRCNCYFVDTNGFVCKNGQIDQSIFMDDMLHFNEDGYKKLAIALSNAFLAAQKDGYKF